MSVMDKNFSDITYAVSSIVKTVIMASRLPEKAQFLSLPRSIRRSIARQFEVIRRFDMRSAGASRLIRESLEGV